jgi:IS4 transposase
VKKLAVNNVDNLNTIKKETIVKLITNIKFSHEDEIINLYKSRWAIEEFYKQLNINLNFKI